MLRREGSMLKFPGSVFSREGTGPRREGSPWTGLWAVVMKEMADHLSSVRMRLLEVLMLLTAIGTVYAAIQGIRREVGQDPFLFLRLFTTPVSQDRPYSFVAFLGFLIPIARSRWDLMPSTESTTVARSAVCLRSPSIATRCCSGSFWPVSSRCRSRCSRCGCS